MARDDDLIDKNFPEEAQEERHARIMRVLSLFAVILVVIFIAGIGYFYLTGNKTVDANHLPTISENNPPEKVKPADPGGMDIPHQDTTVYDQLNPEQPQGAPEKLLPPPEAPVTPTASNSAPATQSTDSGSVEAMTPPTTPANIPNALPTLPAAPADAPKADAAAPVASAPATAAAPASPNDPANFRIQLGAVRDQAAADAEWARMQKRYSDALKGLDARFTSVNLGDKGIFLRIQAGPLTRADATARCAKLIAENQACLIVKAVQ